MKKILELKTQTFKNQVRILSGNQNDLSEDCIRQLKSIKRILLGLKVGQNIIYNYYGSFIKYVY